MIRKTIRDGAVIVGELNYHGVLEMRRIYSACPDLQGSVVMINIQTFGIPPESSRTTSAVQTLTSSSANLKTNFIESRDCPPSLKLCTPSMASRDEFEGLTTKR
ncbi:MAG: hypothetical protein ACJ746_30295 [Bryobacteraceae bacterium]